MIIFNRTSEALKNLVGELLVSDLSINNVNAAKCF